MAAYDPRLGNASAFQDELSAIASDDEKRLQEVQELERMYAADLNARQNQDRVSRVKEVARKAVTDKVKGLAKDKLVNGVAKKLVTRTLLRSLLAYFAVPILVVCLVIGMIMTVVVIVADTCNTGGITGLTARIGSTAAKFFGQTDFDVCAEMDGFVSAAVEQPSEITLPTPVGSDLVAITGIPIDGADDPRVRSCMMPRLRIIYLLSQTAGIDFAITGAYRAGAITTRKDGSQVPSAHGKGEAVDIAIRPKPGDNFRTDKIFIKKLDALLGIIRSEGFVPPKGDTLDEYRHPVEYATGGHIHIEFNTPAQGGSYCPIPT